MKIKHTLYIILLIFSLVPLYIFGTFMIYENDKKIEMIMKENLAAISGTQILDIENFCKARRESMEMIAHYEIVYDAVLVSLGEKEESDWFSQDYLANMLSERKKNNKVIESVSVIDRDFKVVASSEEFQANEISRLKYVQEEYLKRNFFISDMYEREIGSDTKHVVAAYQGVVRNGEVIGYVVEEINTSFFDQYRSETNLWESGTLYIIDGSNQLITAGTPGEETREQYITSEEERENYNKAWDAVDKEKNPSGEIRYEIDGVDYITYYSDIDYTNWSIRVTVNLNSYIEDTKAYRMMLAVAILSASLLLIIVNYLLTGHLTRPVENIAETLQKIQEEQNYTLRVDNGRRDEIGILTEKVNDLLEYIEKENLLEKERQRKLILKAERDPLTGVKNKKAVEEQIQDMVTQAAEENKPIVVGFVDIDDFKDYNTSYGHLEGDHVIQFVASVLDETIEGAVGRVGGDEFIFCVLQKKLVWRIEEIAQKVLKKLNDGMINRETEKRMPVSCSIGIAVGNGREISYSEMIRWADEAMYETKLKGKNGYQLVYKEPEKEKEKADRVWIKN